MARPLRIEYAGALYHVTSRGDRQEAIFDDDRDRTAFLNVHKNRGQAIRAAHETGAYGYQQIAKEFGVHFTTVGRIVRQAMQPVRAGRGRR